MSFSFEDARRIVARLKPGERVHFDRHDMEPDNHVVDYLVQVTGFSIADRILGGIMGAAYEWMHYVNPYDGMHTFQRLKHAALLPDGVRTYLEPDRRAGWMRREDHLWQWLSLSLSRHQEQQIRCAIYGHDPIPTKVMPRELPSLVAPVGELAASEMAIELVDGFRCDRCSVERTANE